jgi:hypothetical protein
MSQTHDLIHSLEHETIKGRRKKGKSNSITPHAGRHPSVRGDYEPEDFDDEQITGMTAEQVKDELRRVKQYGKNP